MRPPASENIAGAPPQYLLPWQHSSSAPAALHVVAIVFVHRPSIIGPSPLALAHCRPPLLCLVIVNAATMVDGCIEHAPLRHHCRAIAATPSSPRFLSLCVVIAVVIQRFPNVQIHVVIVIALVVLEILPERWPIKGGTIKPLVVKTMMTDVISCCPPPHIVVIAVV